MPDTTVAASPRDRLRAAIAERNRRRDASTSADVASVRAAAYVFREELVLERLGDPDAEALLYRTRRVADAEAGENITDLDLPAPLAARLRERDETVRKIAELGAVRAQLEAEARESKRFYDAAEHAVQICGRDVLVEHAAGLAARMRDTRRRLLSLYDELLALAACWAASEYSFVDGRQKPLPLEPGTRVEFEISGIIGAHQYGKKLLDPIAAPDTEAYRSALRALGEDADAKLPASCD